MSTQGEKFKARENKESLGSGLFAIRLDGKAFHSFTKPFQRPFDTRIMEAMDNATRVVIENVFNSGFVCAYTQSDEINIIVDWQKIDPLFNARWEKLVSVGASGATAGFIESIGLDYGYPLFDARIIPLHNISEVEEYLDWRRLDCQKNAITMVAESVFDKKELLHVSTRERAQLLRDAGVKDFPDGFYWGRLFSKVEQYSTGSYVHSKTGEILSFETLRRVLVVEPATRENVGKVISTIENGD